MKNELITKPAQSANVMFQPELGRSLFKMAQVFAQSGIAPLHLMNKPADIFQILCLGARLGLDPHSSMQMLYVVKGKVSMPSQLMLAIMRKQGLIKNLRYTEQRQGNNIIVTVHCIKTEDNSAISETFDLNTAKKNGWTRNRPVWEQIPTQMLRYKCLALLCRAHFPEVVMGLAVEGEEDYTESVSVLEDNTPQKVAEASTSSSVDDFLTQDEPSKKQDAEIVETPAEIVETSKETPVQEKTRKEAPKKVKSTPSPSLFDAPPKGVPF